MIQHLGEFSALLGTERLTNVPVELRFTSRCQPGLAHQNRDKCCLVWKWFVCVSGGSVLGPDSKHNGTKVMEPLRAHGDHLVIRVLSLEGISVVLWDSEKES